MIGSMTYDQVKEVIRELESSSKIISNFIKNENIEDLEDFIATVESYAKYLKTTIELNKDADKALEDLTNKKN